MRYEDDIIRRDKWKLICRTAMLNDNAPDSELSDMSSSPLWNSKFAHYIWRSRHLLNILIF